MGCAREFFAIRVDQQDDALVAVRMNFYSRCISKLNSHLTIGHLENICKNNNMPHSKFEFIQGIV